MNYYERHLGDIAKDTAHLSALEFGIYDLLMDRYYASEKPIPLSDIFRIARARTKEEKSSAEYVVSEFFQEHDGCIFHKRIDAEIEKYHEKKPKREKEKADAAERQKRARDRRISLFETLRDIGIVPHIKTTTSELERMIDEYYNTQESRENHGSVTRDNTLTSPQSPVPSPQTEEPNGSSHTVETANSSSMKTTSRFEEFWQAYPAKAGKKPSLAIWKSKRLDDKADELIADIQLRAGSDRKWLGGFIPNPATYLRQERWTDAIDRAQTNGSPRTARNAAAIAEARRRVMGTNDQVVGVTS
ncbi:MAG: YdaU family protein [Syntrophomonadaceae bacterium]|nr:YdaU family protein [Syntrophomonadaceae bacterium]